METGPLFFALAIPAILFAGISKGGFGSNAAFAAAPFLALILEPAQALGIMMPLLMLMDVSALPAYWRKWDRAASRLLIAGGIPGVLAGAALFRVAEPDLIRLAIGAISIGFVIFQVARRRGWIRAERLPSGPLAGVLVVEQAVAAGQVQQLAADLLQLCGDRLGHAGYLREEWAKNRLRDKLRA